MNLTLTGTITRVIFSDVSGGFGVVDVALDGGGHATVRGKAPELAPGMKVRATGSFREHPRFGPQFSATTLMVLPPDRPEGIAAWLASGSVPGVGGKTARRLAAHFGEALRESLDEGAGRLVGCPGIGRAKAAAIAGAWETQRARRETWMLLAGMGMSHGQVARLMRAFGDEAPARVRDNPYGMIREVPGIGFRTADAIAARIGIDRDSPLRAAAAVEHVLAEACEDGHLFLPWEAVVTRAAELTGLPAESVSMAMERLVDGGRLVAEGRDGLRLVWESSLHAAEMRVAGWIGRLMSQELPPVFIPRAVGMRLAGSQRPALEDVAKAPIAVLTGGPGTGKTTIVSALCAAAEAARLKVVLAAPTGRAAVRIKEATGREAKTIHRLLEFNPRTGRFNRDASMPLDADWVVVDEASMMDIRLADRLLAAVAPGTRLTLVGDADQLPPVGPGDPFRDVIASGSVPVARLTQVFRQGGGSSIVDNAHRILAGQEPVAPLFEDGEMGDFYVVLREEPSQIAAVVERLVAERIPARLGLDPVREVQVLAPMHRGDCGTAALNSVLRGRLNPRAEDRNGLALGDRVIQNRNNYDKDVFNGDIGVVTEVDPGVRVRFEDREVALDAEEVDDLGLAHAITIHKAQGSEFPAVVVALHTQHFLMLRRNLLYTAITRGRRLVVLVANRRALRLAVENTRMESRNTRLAGRLRDEHRQTT